MNAADLLTAAADLVSGDRADQHGDMLLNHENIATMWNAYLVIRQPGCHLMPDDVAIMMALMKVARTQSGADNDDDLVDGAAYLAVASQVGDDQ